LAYPLETEGVFVEPVTLYHFEFKSFGWAYVIFKDVCPRKVFCLMINSDWGTWAYTWRRTEEDWWNFFTTAGNEYLAAKLAPLHKNREFDAKETILNLKTQVICNRKNDFISKEKAREIWDSLSDDTLDTRSEDLFLSNAPDCLWEAWYNLYEWIVYKPNTEYVFLRDSLLPVLKDFVKQEFINKSSNSK